MFDYIFNRKISVQRPSLYCVWIRAHEAENAPLISIWIDPALDTFKSSAQETPSEIGTSWEQDQIVSTNHRPS